MKYTFKFGLSKYITNFDADGEWENVEFGLI